MTKHDSIKRPDKNVMMPDAIWSNIQIKSKNPVGQYKPVLLTPNGCWLDLFTEPYSTGMLHRGKIYMNCGGEIKILKDIFGMEIGDRTLWFDGNPISTAPDASMPYIIAEYGKIFEKEIRYIWQEFKDYDAFSADASSSIDLATRIKDNGGCSNEG